MGICNFKDSCSKLDIVLLHPFTPHLQPFSVRILRIEGHECGRFAPNGAVGVAEIGHVTDVIRVTFPSLRGPNLLHISTSCCFV